MHKLRIRQSGQAIVAVLIIMLLSVAGLVLMYNTGQATSEKLRVVNAADAAAYSGGVWVARQLNFMAYTNRAMIANHVAVGHFVSFASWLGNLEDNVDRIEDIARFIPGVGQVVTIVATVLETYREIVEGAGDIYVPGVDTFNRVLYASQAAARINLNPLTLNSVMHNTARNYGDNIQVNDLEDLARLAAGSNSGVAQRVGEIRRGAAAVGRIGDQLLGVFQFARSYDTAEDDDRIKGLVDNSLDSSESWIQGERGWVFTPFPLRFIKRGSTVHTAVDSGPTNECNRSFSTDGGQGLNWYAKDELELRAFSFRRFSFRFRFRAAACADASATDFSSGYSGIEDYYALRNESNEHQMLLITAYTTLDVSESAVPVFHTFRESNPAAPHFDVKLRDSITSEKVTAFAEAEVFYGSNEALLFSREEGEYSNLFNPYWHARSNFGMYDRISAMISGVNQ